MTAEPRTRGRWRPSMMWTTLAVLALVAGCAKQADDAQAAETTTPEEATTTTEASTTTTKPTTTTEKPTTTTRDDPGHVDQADYGDEWPLTVPDGDLRCVDDSSVIFLRGGLTYAVNGLARGSADENGWRLIDEIWRDDPSLPGTKVDMHPLIERGLDLC